MTNHEPARCLVLHNRYRQPGGEDICVADQVRLLQEHGHAVRLFEKDNREIDSYGLLRRARLFFETAGNSRSAAEVARIVAEFKPDVAHVHNTLPLLSPSIYAPLKTAGVKVIQWLHNYRLVCPAGTLYRDGKACTLCVDEGLAHAVKQRCWNHSKLATLALTRMLERHRRARTWFEQVDLFVALNRFQRDLLVKAGLVPEGKIIVRPHFRYAPAAPKSETQPGEGFLFAGRLTQEKGVQTLAMAADEARVPLKILGDGPLRAAIAERHSAIRMPGHVPHEQVLEEIAKARAVVVPSEWQEPFGLTSIEAMALGKPVIASRVAGSMEIVQDGVTGLLFEPGDVSGLAQCLRRLQDDAEFCRKLGAAGRERFEKEYSPEAGYARMVEVCRRVGVTV
jgi:glycosyltransferase involved in cell wall biosynthesis